MMLITRFQLPRLVIAPYQCFAFSTMFPVIRVLQTIIGQWETSIFRSGEPNNKNAYQTVIPAIGNNSPSRSTFSSHVARFFCPAIRYIHETVSLSLFACILLRSLHSRKPNPFDPLCIGSPYLNYACSPCVLRHAFAFPHTACRGQNLLSKGRVAR